MRRCPNDYLELIDQKKKPLWLRAQVSAMLRSDWQQRLGKEGIDALCPALRTEYYNQQQMAVKQLSTWEYVSMKITMSGFAAS